MSSPHLSPKKRLSDGLCLIVVLLLWHALPALDRSFVINYLVFFLADNGLHGDITYASQHYTLVVPLCSTLSKCSAHEGKTRE